MRPSGTDPGADRSDGPVQGEHLTYLVAERVVPGYNVMTFAKAALESEVRYLAWELGPHNLRVNAVPAGPIKTLAASAVKGRIRQPVHLPPGLAPPEQPRLHICPFFSGPEPGQLERNGQMAV